MVFKRFEFGFLLFQLVTKSGIPSRHYLGCEGAENEICISSGVLLHIQMAGEDKSLFDLKRKVGGMHITE